MDGRNDIRVLAKRLISQLRAKSIDSKTHEELRRTLPRFLSSPDTRGTTAVELDNLGTELWNASTTFHRDGASRCPGKLFAMLRACAFSLLHGAHQVTAGKGKKNAGDRIRVLGVALKAARTCLEKGELDLCSQIFQAAADHVTALTGGDRQQQPTDDLDPVDEVAQRMTSEFWILRVGLSWKQDKLDIANFYFSKVTLRYDSDDDLKVVEKLADTTYEMGKGMLKQKRYADAVPWLERSCNALDQAPDDRLSADNVELRMSAIHDLASAFLNIKDDASLNRAADLIALLESQFGNKMAIALLKLSLLSSREPIRADDYQRVVVSIITSAVLTDNAFTTIMHHVQKLKTWNPPLAMQTVDDFLAVRLYEAQNVGWIEKTVVTRIWISMSLGPSLDGLRALVSIIDHVYDCLNRSISPEATHAAQTLLWKQIEAASSAGSHDLANAICRVAMHRLFERSDEANKSKLARKAVIGALSSGDTNAAREAYYQMPESGKNAAATRYLLYRIAMQSHDEELATETLTGLVGTTTNDPTFLYACVLEAQKAGNRRHTVMVLQKVLERYDYGPPPGIYLPALLRCTAQMLITDFESGPREAGNVLKEVCKIFEAAVAQQAYFRDDTAGAEAGSYDAELKWFAKSSYNLALKHCVDVHPELTIRLLRVCVDLITLQRPDAQSQEIPKLDQRELLCHFLATSALIVLARSEDRVDASLQQYLAARSHIEAFLECLKTRPSVSESVGSPKLDAKISQLLRFELEAIVKLEKWDDLDAALVRCLEQTELDHLETLADLVIVIHTHMTINNVHTRYQEKIPVVMQKLINQSWRSEKHNIEKLSRWLRCVFRMTVTINQEIALQVVDQATSIATRSQRYPQDEIEWLASTAFNHAVDLRCASDREGCRVWGERALNLAKTVSGDNALYNQMSGLWLRLNQAEEGV